MSHPKSDVMRARLLAGAALIGAMMLGACGKTGALDRPAPLFGAKAKADYAAEKKREAAAAAKGGGSDPAPPAPDYGQGDPALNPLRASPPPGAPSSPLDNTSAGGVIPDPFRNPNAQPR